jgi:hypothetical protein
MPPSRRNVSRWVFLILLAAVVSCGAQGADSKTNPVSRLGPGMPFAIADLDGDLRPDLANIQTGRSDVSQTDYWIQLQLSAAQRQTILVVAPTGGLQIVARDVNGDHALDLVLTTAWLKEPVAILLNDGHGVFPRARNLLAGSGGAGAECCGNSTATTRGAALRRGAAAVSQVPHRCGAFVRRRISFLCFLGFAAWPGPSSCNTLAVNSQSIDL